MIVMPGEPDRDLRGKVAAGELYDADGNAIDADTIWRLDPCHSMEKRIRLR
jgi:hypothetical protein